MGIFNINRIKKNIVNNYSKERFELKSYKQQIWDEIYQTDYPDFRDIAYEILKKLSEADIINIFSDLYSTDISTFEKLMKGFEKLEFKSGVRESKDVFFAFTTKVHDDFNQEYNSVRKNSDRGDLIAFLISKYFEFSNDVKYPFLRVLHNDLKTNVFDEIKKHIFILESEIESQSIIPIKKAIHVFLLYNKFEAIEKLRKIIQKDLDERRLNFHQMEYLVNIDDFFEKLVIDYIPTINIYTENFSSRETSITKKELKRIMDNGDFFNKKVPLIYFNRNNLINPTQDIKNMNELRMIFSVLFDWGYVNLKSNKKRSKSFFDLGEVFVENITQPYPKYTDHQLIFTREILKEILVTNDDFKTIFFGIIYLLKENEEILKWNTKFPILFNEYLNDLKGYSIHTIKDYFRSTEKNPIITKQHLALNFLKDHGLYKLND